MFSSNLVLPALAPTTFWDEAQWKVWWAFMEAIVPSIREASEISDDARQVSISKQELSDVLSFARANMPSPPSDDKLKEWLDYCAAEDPAFRQTLMRSLTAFPDAMQRGLGGVLSLLSTRLGSLCLTWYRKPFYEQPLHVRIAILKSWQRSNLATLVGLSNAFASLAQMSVLKTSPLFKEITGFSDVPANHQPVGGFDFQFLTFPPPPSPDVVIETDVVIIGSGCGGAVCAKILAEAGHKVLVVDKGYRFQPAHFPLSQELGAHYLFENNGFLGSDDSTLNVTAGSCWGGGGTVNWSVSLQTQGYVRREWAEKHGLPFFTSPQFQASLDRVCGEMGVGTDKIQHNHRNRVLMEGSRKLGWHSAPVPQNTGSEHHDCGLCHLGCSSEGKKGTSVCWLPAAAKAGAQFIEGFDVEKVTFDESSGIKRANGIVGQWVSRDADGKVSTPLEQRVSRRVIIKAKRVILSAGTLSSPLVLMRSGFKNRHIGQHLRLHPVKFAGGYWQEETTPWEGGIITSYSTNFENLDGAGHGVKLEPMCMVPYLALAGMPWRSGLDFKLSALRYRHFNSYISLTRDSGSGSVYPDPLTGKPRIAYTVSDTDRAHAIEGVIALAKICYVEGAKEIHAFIPGVEPFVRQSVPSDPEKSGAGMQEQGVNGKSAATSGVNDPRFVAWLDRVRKKGTHSSASAGVFASAHQMGTCRMATDEDHGVVDSKGRVFGAEDLYVADASVFPSASGVNPMITNMAIADWVAQGVASGLEAGGAK